MNSHRLDSLIFMCKTYLRDKWENESKVRVFGPWNQGRQKLNTAILEIDTIPRCGSHRYFDAVYTLLWSHHYRIKAGITQSAFLLDAESIERRVQSSNVHANYKLQEKNSVTRYANLCFVKTIFISWLTLHGPFRCKFSVYSRKAIVFSNHFPQSLVLS